MTLTNMIEITEKNILEIINSSGLHPSISKLILSNIIKDIENFEKSPQNKEIVNEK